jgi:trans-2,3-dihydro-3-hydroxyanthranilate isomerase
MRRRYRTVDVFTDRMFGGNPLAVVLDAEGLSTAQMQAVAAEFNYAETTFVLPPRDAAHTAQLRIFTPRHELPFAGHPNVGTAFVLAQDADGAPSDPVFEEAAGLVHMRLLHDAAQVIGAELTAPQPLHVGGSVSPVLAAAALSLTVADIRVATHPPRIASVGMPFLLVELDSLAALARAEPSLPAHRALFPLDGAREVYAYVRGPDGDLDARMFAPLDGIAEDPATGSATAAIVALLAEIHGHSTLSVHARQGVQMGRPSLLQATAQRVGDAVVASVGGQCVAVMQGSFTLAGAIG